MNKHKTKKIVGALAITITTLGLTACDPSSMVGQVTGESHCKPGPIVDVIADVSPSTLVQRAPDGPYELAVMDAATHTAGRCGTLYAVAADGDAIANGRWAIDGKSFDATVRLDGELGSAAREQNARKLKPLVRKLLGTKSEAYAAGTDILGSLTRLAEAQPGIRRDSKRPKVIVLVSDGVLYVRGHYSMYKTPLNTVRRRKKFLARLRRGGEIPNLKGWTVHAAGIGIGIHNRETARWVLRFWRDQLIPATGATVGSIDSTLRFL